MSEDQKTDSPTPRRRRWPTVLLAASLTLNVLILGVIAGAHFRDDRDQRSPPPDRAVLREGGFMPFFEAMPRESRRRMAEAFRDSVPGRGPDRTALVADFRNFVAALRAEPFERDALNEVLEALRRSCENQRPAPCGRAHVPGPSPETRRPSAFGRRGASLQKTA